MTTDTEVDEWIRHLKAVPRLENVITTMDGEVRWAWTGTVKPARTIGAHSIVESWFPGVSTGRASGPLSGPLSGVRRRWDKSGVRSTTAAIGTLVHREVTEGHSTEKHHKFTVAVRDALADQGLSIVCGDTLVHTPLKDVATGIDVVAVRAGDPDKQVVLIELKTGGGAGIGWHGGGARKHALAPLQGIPQTMEGFAHAQLALSAFLFNKLAPAGVVAREALVVHVFDCGSAKRVKVTVTPCMAPFLDPSPGPGPGPGSGSGSGPGPGTPSWSDVLMVGEALIYGRVGCLMDVFAKEHATQVRSAVSTLRWKQGAGSKVPQFRWDAGPC